MIRRLRLKFVAICMALVSVVLAVVFSSVYVTAARNMESLSRQVLHRVLQEDGNPFIGAPSRPDASINIGGMAAGASRSQLCRGVYMSEEERRILRQMQTEGTEVYVQVVYAEAKTPLSKYL